MSFTGRWFIGFGIFLILCGVAGYLSNPAGAKTALMSGGMFGGLSALWGFFMLKGFHWAKVAAWITTILLVGAFAWRSVAGWMAYAAGEPKLFAASLITLMLRLRWPVWGCWPEPKIAIPDLTARTSVAAAVLADKLIR